MTTRPADTAEPTDDTSEASDEETTTEVEAAEETTSPEDALALSEADTEKWKALAKKHEGRAKVSHAELEKLRATAAEAAMASMSDQEKAVAEAMEEGRKAALAEGRDGLLRAKLEAAGAGKVAAPDDLYLYLSDEERAELDPGDAAAVVAFVDGLLATKPHLAAAPSKPTGDLDGGAKNDQKPRGDDDLSVEEYIEKDRKSRLAS